MVTGDLTHWGEPDAYGELREILDDLPFPWHPLLGNHDVRTASREALADFPWHEDGFLQYSLETSVGRFVVLDTVDDGHGNGRLCATRLGWLRTQLEDTRAAGEDVYLFMHHAPFEVGINGLDRIRLLDAEGLIDTLAGFDHIRHLFMGHLHRTCHGAWRGIPFSTVKATAHQVALIVDNQTSITTSRENPAYAIVLIGEHGVVIHDHSYLEEDCALSL